jgi:hypothetical protein
VRQSAKRTTDLVILEGAKNTLAASKRTACTRRGVARRKVEGCFTMNQKLYPLRKYDRPSIDVEGPGDEERRYEFSDNM